MDDQFKHFERQMIKAGLTVPGDALFGFLDAELSWNRESPDQVFAKALFDGLNINSLVFSKAAEPYRTILDYLTQNQVHTVFPQDCETRTFLHDLPVAAHPDPTTVIPLLKKRKSVIIPGHGIVTYGTVSLEQAFVTFSSVCFSMFVKFFSDYLAHYKKGTITPDERSAFNRAVSFLSPVNPDPGQLKTGPFDNEEDVIAAMDEAGKRTVDYRLVDSFFGNISYLMDNTLYISQTGSSLDHLPGCIDPCPLDGSSCAAITASSELSAHMGIIRETGCKAILHGHPRFSVILSMDCDVAECEGGDRCYLTCAYKRDVNGIPIVPGEVGTGPYGLCNTVPPALRDKPGVIVYGHGLFTISDMDFNLAFRRLLDIENQCRNEYFRRVGL